MSKVLHCTTTRSLSWPNLHFGQNSALAGRRPGWVEIDCSDQSQFRSRTPSEFYRIVDMVEHANQQLEAGLMMKQDCEDLEKSSGIVRNPHGLFADSPLRHTAKQNALQMTASCVCVCVFQQLAAIVQQLAAMSFLSCLQLVNLEGVFSVGEALH